MPVTPPIAPDQAPEGTKKVYDRISETIGDGDVPVGYQMMGHVEAFVQDAYMNNKKFIAEGKGKLDQKMRVVLALAASSANNCVHCVRSHAKSAVADHGLSEQEVAEVLALTATCAMYNTLFKFRDLAEDENFGSMPVELRAHTFQKTSFDDQAVELINIVVSTINGCGKCTSNHTKKALQLGLSHEQIDEAVKIAATMTAFNVYHRTQ